MTDLGSFTHDNLLAGDFPLTTMPVTVLSGESVPRGRVMGKVTASGKYRSCNDALSDGAEVAEAVMAEAVDASAADAPGIVYLTGDFNSNSLSFGGDDVVADHYAEMRLRSMFIHGSASVLGTIS